MATLPIKLLGVAGGVAGVSAAGYGATYLIPNKPTNKISDTPAPSANKDISSLLKGGKRLLTKNNGDTNKWNTPWSSFKRAHESTNPKSPWNFTDWSSTKESSLESFKDQCVSLGGQKVTGEQDAIFIEVNTYCTTTDPA